MDIEYEVDFQDYRCRLCLKDFDNTENLVTFDSKYKSITESFIGLQIKITTDLPSMICNACVNVINILLEFKETCIKSQEILEAQQNIVKFQEIPTKSEYFENNLESMLDVKIEEKSEDESREETVSLDGNTDSDSTYWPSDEEPEKSKKKTTTNKTKSSQKTGKNSNLSTIRTQDTQNVNKTMKNIKKENGTNTTNDEETPKKESKQTPCYICGKMIHRFRMQLHLNIHLDIRPYQCKIEGCNKAFPSPRQLRQHNTYNHNKEEPFECDICKRRYKTNAALRMHKTYHFEPDIPCQLCGKLFRNSKALKKHMFNHTGERPFKCDVCSRGFKDPWALKVHLKKIHDKIQPFICTICEAPFGHNIALKTHMETHHLGNSTNIVQDSNLINYDII